MIKQNKQQHLLFFFFCFCFFSFFSFFPFFSRRPSEKKNFLLSFCFLLPGVDFGSSYTEALSSERYCTVGVRLELVSHCAA